MIRIYKNCIIEFFAWEDFTWAADITYPDEDTENVGFDFPSFNAAYLAAIQKIEIGLISRTQ